MDSVYCIAASSKSSDSIDLANNELVDARVVMYGPSFLLVKGALDDQVVQKVLYEYFHVDDDLSNVEDYEL